MSRLLILLAVLAVGAALFVVIGDDDSGDSGASSASTLTEQAREVVPDAAPPRTSERLATVPLTVPARTRLAYVDPERLEAAGTALPVDELRGAAGPDAFLYDGAERPPVERSAIAPEAQAAAQSCLGETLVQVILGPRVMGRHAAFGVGVAESADTPGGYALRICAAPYYLRHVDATLKKLEKRFGDVQGAVIRENEIGEREIGEATLPVTELDPDEVVDLVTAGRDFRALGWR